MVALLYLSDFTSYQSLSQFAAPQSSFWLLYTFKHTSTSGPLCLLLFLSGIFLPPPHHHESLSFTSILCLLVTFSEKSYFLALAYPILFSLLYYYYFSQQLLLHDIFICLLIVCLYAHEGNVMMTRPLSCPSPPPFIIIPNTQKNIWYMEQNIC